MRDVGAVVLRADGADGFRARVALMQHPIGVVRRRLLEMTERARWIEICSLEVGERWDAG